MLFFPIEQNNVLTLCLHIHVCVYSKWQSLRKGAFLHLLHPFDSQYCWKAAFWPSDCRI